MFDPRMSSKTGLQDKISSKHFRKWLVSMVGTCSVVIYRLVQSIASWTYILTYTYCILLHTCM